MKTELTFRLPVVSHKHAVSDQLLQEFHAFVGETRKQKYIFLSKVENIVVEETPFFKEQLPPDVFAFSIMIEGPNSFVEVRSRSSFKNLGEISDQTLNQVVIQGPNPVAVRGLHSKVAMLLRPQQFTLRSIFYRYPLICFWSSLILLWFGEYRVAKLFVSGLNIRTPLSALGAILIGAIGLGSILAYANLLLPFFRYWFPYFEIEGNISQHRLSFQKLIGALGTSFLAAGIWNLATLLSK